MSKKKEAAKTAEKKVQTVKIDAIVIGKIADYIGTLPYKVAGPVIDVLKPVLEGKQNDDVLDMEIGLLQAVADFLAEKPYTEVVSHIKGIEEGIKKHIPETVVAEEV